MIQKKITDFLFSTRLMAVLFIVFAIGMAVGTFLEDSYTTEFARIYVYNAKWFELVMILLAINFLGNIGKYKLWRREKWPTLLLHLSFFLIILGAGISRYISYEGIMPIRVGETTNKFLSQKTYLTAYIDGDVDGETLRKREHFPLLLAEGANNRHTLKTDFKGQKVKFEVKEFIYGAKRTIVEDPNGKRYIKMVESSSGQRNDHFLEEGQVNSLNNILFAFNKETEGAINIYLDNAGNYSIDSPFPGDYLRMSDQKEGELIEDSIQPLMMGSLYTVANLGFVFPEEAVVGRYDIVADADERKNGTDAVIVNVTTNGETKEVKLLGSGGMVSNFSTFDLGGLDFNIRYGSKEYELPFTITLNQFIAEKYPGTANNPTPSYSSFMSKVTVEDQNGVSDHDIYMNHVLDHRGFRFFQASFMPDEQGTVLSVNHDYWGTLITYKGYGFLYLGMILILFVKGSRFKDLEKKLKSIRNTKKKRRNAGVVGILGFLMLMTSFSAFSQVRKEDYPGYDEQQSRYDTITKVETVSEDENHEIIGEELSFDEVMKLIRANVVPQRQAEDFGKLVIQDYRGRMKPVNTYSSELLRKLSRKDHFYELSSDQVMISMTQNPFVWYTVPIIKIKHKDEKLREILGIEEGTKMVKFIQFFNRQGEYKLGPYLEEAYRSKIKSQFQKDLIDADGQVNLLHNALEGRLLRIFPIPGDEDNKWVSYPDVLDEPEMFIGQDSLFVANALPLYMQTLHHGVQNGDFTQANSIREGIRAYQMKFGEQVMPTEKHINAEVLYNKYDIFKNLFQYYLYAGLFLFIFVILEIFYPKKWIYNMIVVGKYLTLLLFVLHTAGLIARWYISGHAPWSDAYESMIYVGWATMLFGLIFGRKSELTVASTAFVAAIIMMIAHWNWMDPSIANLEPVLDSYWIMIHTSVIVASYGPFTLGMILGLVSLLLMIFTNSANLKKMRLNIREITIINEMALTVGLVLLTIGNFLGGQWANESWGRYWSWDPKETWALISIMVYAFVIHMRLVPGLSNRFAFNWITILAFGSILMTYFGVNFYLSGLHSYASGDQIISYKFIGLAFGLWLLLGGVAYRSYLKYYKKGKVEM